MPLFFEFGRVRIRFKFLAFLLLIAAGIIAYLHVARRRQSSLPEMAYVLPSSLVVVDTPAEIHLAVESVKAGDRVQVLLHTQNWTKVELPSGRTGWVQSRDILDSQTYETSQKLLKELEDFPVQAQGHTPDTINLRFEPSRDSVMLAQLPRNQKLEVFQRKIVERSSPSDQSDSAPAVISAKARVHGASTPVKEAWYLVRAGPRAGWVLGRYVSLDIPEPLAAYAQGSNMVAWLVLKTTVDEGRPVAQYLAADRNGSTAVDFNHIRVFTWWVKNHRYVTSYVESGLDGYFPIHVMRRGDVPYFRLNLVGRDGNKIQKVYGLFDTITRPLGTVEGWEGDAMPTPSPSRRGRGHR